QNSASHEQNKNDLSAGRKRLSRPTTGDVERQEVSCLTEWKRSRVESGKIPRREENRRQQGLGRGRYESCRRQNLRNRFRLVREPGDHRVGRQGERQIAVSCIGGL